MSFISISFLVFLSIVLILLKAFSTKTHQHIVLLVASYLFYSMWDWRFLLLLFGVSCTVWFLGKQISKRKSSSILALGLVICIGVLGIFKYLNFFVDTFCHFFHLQNGVIRLILPVGISFYIFQAISYLWDIYNGKIVSADLLQVLVYIGFFPQIVSGPIVKAHMFLPQLEIAHPITKSNLSAGSQMFLIGVFKKVVVADRLAVCVDTVFAAPEAYSGLSLLITVMAYSIQIYCDFSGYSDMAIGVARCMGYHLGKNFNMPYLAQNPSDFWRRWHISLSSWFRDYVYIPLGGSRKGTYRTCFNLFITMFLSGVWHGASWNYWLWGILHGILAVSHKTFLICKNNLQKKSDIKKDIGIYHKLVTISAIILNTCAVCLLWIPFRVKDVSTVWMIISRIITMADGVTYYYTYAIIFGVGLLIISIWCYVKNMGNAFWQPLDLNLFRNKIVICMLGLLIVLFAYIGNSAFLYAQF